MCCKAETDCKGIPLKGPYPASPPVAVLYSIMTVVFTSVIGTITYFTIIKDNMSATAKLDLLAQYDLGYLYAAIILLRLGQFAMGINAGTARKYCKVKVPDQHVYEVKGAEGSRLGYVLMDTEGDNGKFNRAQRAVANYNETLPQTILYIVFGGFIYPKEVMILTGIYSTSRFVSAVGYTSAPNGRMGGFMISNLTTVALEFIVGFTAYKLLM